MKSFNIHVWNDGSQEWYDSNKIFEEIKSRSPDVVNFFALEEYAFFPRVWDRDHTLYQDFFFENNIRANFFFGVANLDDYPQYFNNPEKNCYVYLDPLFFFRRSFRSYSQNIYNNIYPNRFRYKIMCLLYQLRLHRCMLLDELSNRNLIEHNAITWHQKIYYYQVPGFYTFKHWTPCILKLNSEPKAFKKSNQWNVPLEWHETFLHVISETLVDIIYITEKTVAPLLGGKLFISYAAKGFYQELKKLGFQLYDEIIDYSFDDIDNHEDRLNALMDQIEKIIQLNDYEKVYKDLNEKLRYNQQHAIKLALSPAPDIPQFALDYYNELYSFY